ncbi:hypothetical protein B0H14DRAFT_3546577 [Mycena olivaceomarginata]|nr:hypothetical protein B0H14DRAFT_3546577 [Mycena olivaceomarginata]
MAIGSGGGDLEKVMLIISRAGDDQLEVPNIPEVVTDSGEQEMINSKREIMNARCCRPAPQIGMIVLYYYDRVLRRKNAQNFRPAVAGLHIRPLDRDDSSPICRVCRRSGDNDEDTIRESGWHHMRALTRIRFLMFLSHTYHLRRSPVSAEPALLGTWTRGQIFCTILNVSSRREQQAIHFSGCQAYRFPFVGEAIPDRKKEKIARALGHQQTIFNVREVVSCCYFCARSLRLLRNLSLYRPDSSGPRGFSWLGVQDKTQDT